MFAVDSTSHSYTANSNLTVFTVLNTFSAEINSFVIVKYRQEMLFLTKR